MDFLELAPDETRHGKLDYNAICTLIEYQKHTRDIYIATTLSFDHAKLKDTLAELYPTVIFTGEGYNLTAEVRSDIAGSLAEQFGILTSTTHYLAADYDPSGCHSYQLTFRHDGLGIIVEEYESYEFFDHDLDLGKVEDRYKDDCELIENKLIEYFKEEVGIELDDPFFNPDDESHPIEFESGSEHELERLVKLFALTEAAIEDHEDERIRIYAATDDGDEAHLCHTDDDCYRSKRLESLTDLALKENAPVGWTYEYNDGSYDRRSGYSRYAETLHYEIGDILEAPARERMSARRELRRWLEERGRTLEEFDKEKETEVIAASTEAAVVEVSIVIGTASEQTS